MSKDKTVEVKFIKHHRHGGQDYKPGDTAQVTPQAKDKLKSRGVIE